MIIIKRLNTNVKRSAPVPVVKQEPEKPKADVVKKNKRVKKENNMMSEQIERAEYLAQNLNNNSVKVVKKDRGLIERTESSKIILTEDNRQVLND